MSARPVANTARESGLSIPRLRAGLSGPVLGAADEGYDAARRVVLRSVDRRPAAIVRPTGAGEVARVVSLARESGVELAVRGGGHSQAGHGTSDGGIVLDLTGLAALEIDVDKRIARAAGGLTSGEVTAAAAPHGLAPAFGDTASVGIGGLTLGGGLGYLVRKHGLTIDHLLGAEIVTADGRVLEVDAERHPDLFWAIRGGGGNFGVVTRFDYRLHPVDLVTGGMLALPATPETLAGLVRALDAAPEELSAIVNVLLAPPLPFVPPELVGTPLALALLVHAGPLDEGAEAFSPLRALAAPVADFVRPLPFREMFTAETPNVLPRAVVRTFFSDSLDEPVAGELLRRLRTSTAQVPAAQIRVLGGAAARVPVEATAFAHRQRRLMINVAAVYAAPEEDAAHAEWAGDTAAALRRGDDGAYVNFLGDEGPERVRAAYPGASWDRLAEVKRRYDPENLFRLNQNVPPVG
ncbi:MAG TPA: FAD-binding oxidoreductase [Gaiellaceae bacterium]|nr:FAD-binding oxidoreductase [Gaiellaceae bacterium]